MEYIVGQKEKNLVIAKKFADITYWSDTAKELLAEDVILELPFAPPGWLQVMSEYETKAHFTWFHRTVTNWEWSNVNVYATNYPDKFWIKRDGKGNVFWGGKSGIFESHFLTLIQIKNGKIIYIKDHFDNQMVYRAYNKELPEFYYDAPDVSTLPDNEPVVDVSKDPELLKKKTLMAVKSFVNVDFWEEGSDSVYADNFVHGLPFTPDKMPRWYNRKEYDALNLWLQMHTHDWYVHPGTILYETDHEGEYIIESAGSGHMTWSGGNGTYQNRHVSYLKIVNGYAVKFDEYFNTINKFNSINISVPSLPYLF